MIRSSLKAAVAAILLLSSISFAASNTDLEAGINAYQQGKYDDAKAAFTQLMNQKGWTFTALYNLGNVAARQKHYGEALAYYRRALTQKPRDPDTVFNIQFIQDNMGLHYFGKLGNVDAFRMEVLDRFSFNEFLAATLILSVIFFQFLLGYAKKRQAYKTEDKGIFLSPSPSLIALGFFLALLWVGTGFKLADSYSERATIIAEKVDLRSGPDAGNASMMEIPEGSEVAVLDSAKGWKQVTQPGGGLSGWVPDDAVMETHGGGPW